MLGETEWELFSDGEGDDVVEGTGFACLANFLRAAAKLACPADMDGSLGAGVDSLLCKVGWNEGDTDVVKCIGDSLELWWLGFNATLLFLSWDELPSPSSLSSLESITITRDLEEYFVFVALTPLSRRF